MDESLYAFAILKYLRRFSLFINTNWTIKINLKTRFTVWWSKKLCLFCMFPLTKENNVRVCVLKCVFNRILYYVKKFYVPLTIIFKSVKLPRAKRQRKKPTHPPTSNWRFSWQVEYGCHPLYMLCNISATLFTEIRVGVNCTVLY